MMQQSKNIIKNNLKSESADKIFTDFLLHVFFSFSWRQLYRRGGVCSVEQLCMTHSS